MKKQYILTPNTALRGWRLVPRAYYVRGAGAAAGLMEEEFEILLKCDGKSAAEPSPALDSLISRGLCRPAEDGETLTDWQKYRFCDNRYFPYANWAVTGRCNFNCRHCFNAADNAPLMEEFTWEQCQSFIGQMDDCGVQNVALTGGEPMLHPHFMDVCREIDRRGMVVDELTTNGSFITPGMLDEFDGFKHKPVFKLSFDGIGYHDWFRMKKGAENDTLEKARLLARRGFRVRFQTNVHKGNTDAILPTARLADEIGVESIRIIRTTESPRLTEMGDDICLSITGYYDFALNFIRGFLAEGLGIDIDIWQAAQVWPRGRAYCHRPVSGGAPQAYRGSLPVCRGVRGRVAVTPAGDILPCNQMSGWFKKYGIHMGNVHETPLRELLSGGEYLSHVCYTVGELLEKNPKCQACPHWKLCMGGCRVIGILHGEGEYLSHDPAKCVYFNLYYDKFAELFDDSWRNTGRLTEG